MKIYVNDKKEIKDVGTTTDESLIEYVINDESNPFKNWSVAKICCYKAEVDENGNVTMFTPYVDSRLIEHIEQLGKGNESNANGITDTQLAVAETYEKALTTDMTVTDMQLALVELYEMMLGGVSNG